MAESTISYFESIPAAIPDPILGTIELFRKDPAPQKVNLGVGVYQDENGKTPIFECVKKAAARWLTLEDTKAYLPIEGVPAFGAEVQNLLFGKDSEVVTRKRATTLQAIGGSGALCVGADFLHHFFPNSKLYISDPTWDNHLMLFSAAGHQPLTYPYYDFTTRGFSRDAMFEALRKMESRSIVLVHACCHNPTGVDLEKADWDQFADICAERGLIPFVDFAYQGLGDGLTEDAYGVRALAAKGLSFLVASSFAKSFSIYRERVGALTLVCGSQDEASRVLGQLKRVVRTIYSSPNSYGAQLVAMCLSDVELRELWEQELGVVRARIKEMRSSFTKTLSKKLPEQNFDCVLSQKGMFSYFGLTSDSVRRLREKHHVYAIESGRVCVAAMTPSNMEYVCSSIADVWT